MKRIKEAFKQTMWMAAAWLLPFLLIISLFFLPDRKFGHVIECTCTYKSYPLHPVEAPKPKLEPDFNNGYGPWQVIKQRKK